MQLPLHNLLCCMCRQGYVHSKQEDAARAGQTFELVGANKECGPQHDHAGLVCAGHELTWQQMLGMLCV